MSQKKLVRPIQNRKIAGVCAGFGDYFNISPLIFRITFLLLCLPGGVPGPMLYLLFWIFMPSQQIHITFPGATNPYSNQPQGGKNLGDDYTETIDV